MIIADNSIVGWGSIVTKEFNEPNVIIAGIPAKIVKRGINWDRRCINKYLKITFIIFGMKYFLIQQDIPTFAHEIIINGTI